LAFFIVGCAEVTEGPETVQFHVVLKDWFDVEEPPVEGAEMCQDTANCATTDAGGNVILTLPANERVSWTFMKDGYGSTLSGDVTDATFDASRGLWMSSDEWFTKEFTRLDTPYAPRGTGAVFIAMFPPFAGVTFGNVDATGETFYFDEEMRMQLGLDATTSSGWGGFIEVGAGELQVEIGGTGVGCSPGTAWPGDEPDRIRVPVREGYITYASILCPLP